MRSMRNCLFCIILLLLTPHAADAGVRITMSDEIDPQAEVVVETKIRYASFHGYNHKSLEPDLIKAGESKNKTVLAVIPILFDAVYANAFHPAYYIDSSRSEKAPFALRTVELPMLQPRSWAELLKTGEPLREGGVGITAGAVNDHFYMILSYFLPTFDAAGGQEDLRRHLPLLEQLAAFANTPQALTNSQVNMRRFSSHDPDKYVESVKRTEGGYRLQLMRRLQAIRGWLALDQDERRPMHDWLHHLHKPDYVFNQVMDDADREQVYGLLQQSEKRGHPRFVEWTNPATRVKFIFSLNTRGSGPKNSGYSTRLLTDLNPRLGLDGDEIYSKTCSPYFINDAEKGWHLRPD